MTFLGVKKMKDLLVLRDLECVKALAQVGLAKPQYVPRILSSFQSADLAQYKDSMRPLIEKDMAETARILSASASPASTQEVYSAK